MDKERSAIRIFMKNLGKDFPDPDFITDAIPFQTRDEKLLFSTDEFSSEDNFRSNHPADLGWNLAAATISDIHAAGGVPLYFGHTVTIQSDWDDKYIDRFSKAISECLDESGASFLGGDLGMSDNWRYTGIAIGKQLADINRKGSLPGDLIYMTGSVGAGNLEAALKLYSDKPALRTLLNNVHIRFPLRIKEAVLVRKYANSCIDSSDGVFRALSDLASSNGKGFRIRDLAYHPQGLLACKFLNKPEEILFLGECGEYELVFTVSPEKEAAFVKEAADLNLKFRKLGMITEGQDYIAESRNRSMNLREYSIFARNYPGVKEYIENAVKFILNG